MAIDVACDRIGIPRSEESFAPSSQIAFITDSIRELEADVFRLGVNHTLVVTRSHYEDSIKLDQVCLGYVTGWRDDALEDLERRSSPLPGAWQITI
jgi:hypothetical protein